MGVEEELLVFAAGSIRLSRVGQDLADDEPVDRAEAADAAEPADDPAPAIEHEFKRQQVETTTSPQQDLDTLRDQIAERRVEVAARAAELRAVPVALGTDPAPAATSTTEDPRYEQMAHDFGAVADGQLTCGMHVHVAVDSRDEGVAVIDRIRVWLPVLLALSANSPFHQGSDTGYASYRTVRQEMWPTAGATEIFGTLEVYDQDVASLVATGAAMDEGMIYFDARLSASFPTVEIRVMDVTPTPDIAAVLAGLCRALVETAVADWRRGVSAPSVRRAALRAAGWRSARWGLSSDLVLPGTDELAPAARVVEELLAHVHSALVDAGDLAVVEAGVRLLLAEGNGADRQRQAHARRGEIGDVVGEAVAWTLPRM